MIAALVLALLVAAAYVRLSPSDPAVWHIDPAAPGFVPAPHWAAFCPGDGSRHAQPPGSDPVALLRQIDAIALATPRTQRLAGTPEAGRITWVTRSALIGFPDFTTAAIRPTPKGTQLCIVARQRFGRFDWGVNARRVDGWVQQALGLPEPPGRIWQ